MTSRMVEQFKIKAREIEGPASLVMIEVLSSAEVGQILVVIENFNLVFVVNLVDIYLNWNIILLLLF